MAEDMYATVKQVRRLAGKRIKFESGVKIGTGDGSNKSFFLKKHYFCDGNNDGYIDSRDVTVYDSGSPVTVDGYFPDSGKVLLNAAPANGNVITMDFWVSDIPDSEIEEEILLASEQLERKTGTKFNREHEWTQKWDGNGEQTTFFFDKFPVYSISSYNIDDETSDLTIDEDYFLYPRSDRALWIELYNPPIRGNQNVQITYKYGEQNALANKWVALSAARSIILNNLGEKGNIGTYILPDSGETVFTSDKTYSLYRLLGDELRELEKEIGGRFRMDVVKYR